MKIFKYKNHADYCKAQVAANQAKLGLSWIRPEVVNLACDYILARAQVAPTFGLCHGTRRGEEQKLFSARLGCPVIGTEISPTATQFPNTLQWDFHELRDEWIGACDFVYTNSLDHARRPRKALATWLHCLKRDTGVLVVEWTEKIGKGKIKTSTLSDPFSATTNEVKQLIEEVGGEVFEVVRADGKSRATGHDHKIVLIMAGCKP